MFGIKLDRRFLRGLFPTRTWCYPVLDRHTLLKRVLLCPLQHHLAHTRCMKSGWQGRHTLFPAVPNGPAFL